MKKNVIKNLMFLIIIIISYYFMLPPININSPFFWSFVIFFLILYLVISISTNLLTVFPDIILNNKKTVNSISRYLNPSQKIIVLIIGVIIIGIFLINIYVSPVFSASKYSTRIYVQSDNDFISDIPMIEHNRLPVIDKASTQRLGDRVMGRMPEFVSQFRVSDLYTQINYQNEIVRVTPLEYEDFFKFLANRKEGITGYIMVNSVTGKADLIRLEQGMKYMDSAILNKNLDRKLRFSYPTKIFGDKSFEIDEEGNPYWIVPTIKYVGVGVRPEVEGVIILNPINGESDYYKVEDVPEWVDHVYPSWLIIDQVNSWGVYQRGFLNSLFSQRNVVVTTEGYNYTVYNDDVYLYTGITSVVADESNIGFIMTNLRTKNTNFYEAPGAEEYSAMDSAEGQVQQMNYRATFPLLINVNNKPTYFISLKDNAGLVKMYAFVDVVDYQKVVVTDAALGIEKALVNYIGNKVDTGEIETKTITVQEIKTAIIKGDTHYFIIDENQNIYRANIAVNQGLLIFLEKGEKVEIVYRTGVSPYEINKITLDN